jgi:hypothetical protein
MLSRVQNKSGLDAIALDLPGMDLVAGAIDSHVHCCAHINARTVTVFDAVRQAARAGMGAIGLMDVFANTSGLAALACRELGDLGVEVFGGVILEPYVGGLSVASVEAALSMGYGPGTGARFVSLPCHHTKFVARSEGRSPAYVDACLGIPAEGELPDPLPEIIDLCIAADVVFNTGHLSAAEALRVVSAARRRGAERILVPASYLDSDTAEEIASEGAYLEFGFFVMSHATQVGQTMIDKERHRFSLVQLSAVAQTIRRVGPDRVVLSSDSGSYVLPPPVEAFRELMVMIRSEGFDDDAIRLMTVHNTARLFKVGEGFKRFDELPRATSEGS